MQRSWRRNWERGKIRVRIKFSKRATVIILAILAWLISFPTYGYVVLIGSMAEWFASTPLALRISNIVLALGLIITFYSLIRGRFGVGFSLVGLGVFLLVLGALATAAAYVAMLNDSPSQIQIIELGTAIDTQTSRLVPLHTAYAYAISMLQTPTHTIYEGETYIYYDQKGNIVYNWIIEPEGFWNQISREPLGAVFVNGSVFPPEVHVVEQDMVWGLHKIILNPLFADNLWRELKLRVGMGVRVLADCNIEVYRNGTLYVIVPLVSWRTTMTASVPVPVGYAVVYPDGRIDVVSTEEAKNNPLFRGVPLVPDVIAREWVEIYRYYTGFWSVVLYHNTYTIRDVGRNPQPYLMIDDEGHLYWVFIAEPPGETTSAKYIFYVNASNTNPHIMMYELPNPVIGISRIESLVKQAHPTYDWGEFEIAEPMPLIINSTLYWKVTVITKDGRGLVSVDLINTATNEVLNIKPNGTLTATQVMSYLTGTAPSTPYTGNQTIDAILEKINELKQKIAQQEKELQALYSELEELEKMLQQLVTNTTSQQPG